MGTRRSVLSLLIVLAVSSGVLAELSSPWKWVCKAGNCEKTRNDLSDTDPVLSLEACKMFCNDYGLLWPKPTGTVELGNFLSKINPDTTIITIKTKGNIEDLMNPAIEIFKQKILLSVPEGVTPKKAGKTLEITLINNNPYIKEMSLTMDEGYSISIGPSSRLPDRVNATISADSFFGVRHGLETLSQLIVYDDIRNQMLIARDVTLFDRPVYPYRGVLLDTARNYYSLNAIKRTIDAMSAVKLNTFHWHITDSQSFPFATEKRPELHKLGALSPRKIYTKRDIREIAQYGLVRGVRVMPEFDAPAHVGEGWQDTGLTVCFKAEPWKAYCVEPPCGQLNPTKSELYDVLEDIYSEMAETFQPDIFHMGGDEVSEKCWNSSTEIQDFLRAQSWGLDKSGFLKLWDYFQRTARDRAYKAFGKKIPLILWTSTLTDYEVIEDYLDKEEYIIQVWTTGEDPQIQGLLKKGYKLIMSNYDALYFDCGFGAWVGSGNNWCSPYIGWQKVYDNSPAVISKAYASQILGGEAALWSEQADTAVLDSRLWPRAAALAERLWAEPDTTWQDAEQRLLHVRERLVKMDVQADSIEPEWCYQNEGYCYG